MSKFLVVCALTACVTHHDPDAGVDVSMSLLGPWPTKPPATVRAEAPPAMLAAWDAEFRWHVTDFDFALTAFGCPSPFRIVAPTDMAEHVIELVDTSPDLEPGLNGGETNGATGRIIIRGVVSNPTPQLSPLRGIIAHELGHAVGLGHADPSLGLSAMTVPPDTQLRARDVAEMACLLGCGPC